MINTPLARLYIGARLKGRIIRTPSLETVRCWMRRGLIRHSEHHRWKQWYTTLDAIDEAIMWHRIPPRRGRPRGE